MYMTNDAAPRTRPTIFQDLSPTSRKLRTLFDARVKSRGLTYARARMLLQLSQADGLTQGELAEALAIEQPTIVRQLDAMVAAGLVERRPCDTDRRVRRIFLTEAARDEAGAVIELTETLRDDLAAGIPPEDLEVASDVLRRIALNIERAGEDA